MTAQQLKALDIIYFLLPTPTTLRRLKRGVYFSRCLLMDDKADREVSIAPRSKLLSVLVAVVSLQVTGVQTYEDNQPQASQSEMSIFWRS